MSNYYKPGSWNVVCQVCGGKFKSDEVRKRWDGLIVCDSDYESRHILDFIKVPAESTSVPFVAPEPADNFIFICTVFSMQGVANLGQADCAKADLKLPIEI